MDTTDAGMKRRSGRELPGLASGKDRFDGDSARQILQHAAAVQQRLNNELAGSYSLEELEEMAAEAGISPEALRAAIETHGHSGTGASGMHPAEQPRWSALKALVPGHWSPAVKGAVLALAGGIAFVALLLAFPAFAEMVFWGLLILLILLALLVAVGASPV